MSILVVAFYKLSFSLLHFIGGSHLAKPVLFESFESKNPKGGPVYNEISLEFSKAKDIWKMKQSHQGINAKDWDEIQIIVDKSVRPYLASYHQLKNGKEIEYKVSCLSCHPSGPRAIRPVFRSKKAALGVKEKMTIFTWNALIKSYGHVKVAKNEPFKRTVPLSVLPKKFIKELKLEACSKCHKKGGPRSPLTNENVSTIYVLVENGHMPPWPHKLTTAQKNALKAFYHQY